MTDIWVCGDCHSVNPIRSGRCYKCRAPRPPAGEEMTAAAAAALEMTPVAAPAPKMLDPERVAASGILAPAPKPERTRPEVSKSAAAAINPAARVSTMPAAVVGIALLIVVLGVRLLLTRYSLASIESILRGEEADDSVLVGGLGILYPLLGVLAIAGLGFWAYRVMSNVPLLGGGWTRFTPAQAFLEHVIPGWNVLRTPGVYREIQTRLSEDGGANDLLIAAWVLVNIAAVVIVRPIGSTIASFAGSIEDQVSQIAIFNYLSIGLQGVAVLLIALLVAEIESQQSARAKSLVGATVAPVEPELDAATTAAHEAVVSRPFTAAVASRGSHDADDQPIGTANDEEDRP